MLFFFLLFTEDVGTWGKEIVPALHSHTEEVVLMVIYEHMWHHNSLVTIVSDQSLLVFRLESDLKIK